MVELLAGLTLALLVAFYLLLSWRKWPDLQIDFGRELYVPWRLAAGEVLGRDVESPFGPLSPYCNAALFSVFGPGLMVLVTANLAIYTAILGTAYGLFRRAWGVAGAWTGAVVFIGVFSFSQYLWTGNYNYATPYAHEATHGMLVCLLLAVVVDRYVRRPAPMLAALGGGLLGLTALLKIEFIAAGVILVATGLLLRRQAGQRAFSRQGSAAFVAAAILPSLLFWVGLARSMTWDRALLTTGKAWLAVFTHDRFIAEADQQTYLGTDHFLANLQTGLIGALTTVAIIAGILAGARGVSVLENANRVPRWPIRLAAVGVIMLGVVAGVYVSWLQAGSGLVWLTLAAAAITWNGRHPTTWLTSATPTRLLLQALALALLLRMAFNVRLHHYGFIQAALAATTTVAALVAEWTDRFVPGKLARQTARAGHLAMVGIGVAMLTSVSHSHLEHKTAPIGAGVDLFYHYSRDITPEGEVPPDDSLFNLPVGAPISPALLQESEEVAGKLFEYNLARENNRGTWLRETVAYLARTAPEERVLILPEGIIINYLARRLTPLPATKYFGAELVNGRESRLVSALRAQPPQHVVVLSRDVRGSGTTRYGGMPGEGRLLMEWVTENYQPVARAGGDPLEPSQVGIALFRHRNRSSR